MKKMMTVLLSLCILLAAFTLTACGDQKPQETTFDKFANDWYAYKMTTITDGGHGDVVCV